MTLYDPDSLPAAEYLARRWQTMARYTAMVFAMTPDERMKHLADANREWEKRVARGY